MKANGRTFVTGQEKDERRKKVLGSASFSNDLLCVGNFKIRKEGDLVFIKEASGESGGFNADLFEKCISDFFNKNF